MQISSSHSGFNFSSVYKSVVSRPSPQTGNPAASTAGSHFENHNEADKLNRETLQLKAAQRSADRSAGQLESLADL